MLCQHSCTCHTFEGIRAVEKLMMGGEGRGGERGRGRGDWDLKGDC